MSKISTGNAGEVKSCCDVVKVNSSDELASYLANKLTAGAYVIFTVKDGVEGSTIEITLDTSALSGQISSSDQLVKASSTDTNAASYLFNKLTHASPANGTILVKKNPAGTLVYFELDAGIDNLNDVTLSAMAAGQILRWDKASSKWVNDYSIEGTFSGTSTKIPASSALKTFLKALTITDAADCGVSGASIMWKTISVPVTNACVCEGGQADFADHYPSTFSNIDLISNQGMTFAERGLGLKLITTESAISSAEDGYGAVVLEAMIDEDCSDNNTIFLDTVVSTKTNGGNYAQTNLRCVALGLNEDQTIKTSPASDVKILDAAGLGLIKKASFAIDIGEITAAKFFAIKFFLYSGSALITPDAGYACMDEFTLLSARVRYPIKTINLRDADIDL